MAGAERLTRAERQAQTREALLEAAGRVFVARGFSGSSVEAICEAAGFTRGAFYSNFSSKEELFVELLQDRVYSIYRRMGEGFARGEDHSTVREIGARVGAVQAHPEGRWLFRLWLELLAHADRDERLRELASGFWSGNRALMAKTMEDTAAASGFELPAPADALATAQIAMDIGLALQHYVDPEAVPLELYPDLWEVLFSPLDPRPKG